MNTVELWGTFSVRDHLAERAFVADVLLYDRLVIPTLPADRPETEWPAKWNLRRQKALLGDLGDLAIAIPWSEDRQDVWQKRFDGENAPERRAARSEVASHVATDVLLARDPRHKDLPYRITRNVLQDFANDKADDRLFGQLRVTRKARPGSTLEAVSAYPSFDMFARDTIPADAALTDEARRFAPTAVFGWQFFVPESADFGEEADRRLLEKAIKLAKKADFIEAREIFYGWWSDVVANKISVVEARADMEKRIADFQKLTARAGWETVARYAVKILDAFTGALGLVSEYASAGAEAFLGNADILLDERSKREDMPASKKVAAIFHDARKSVGWNAGRG